MKMLLSLLLRTWSVTKSNGRIVMAKRIKEPKHKDIARPIFPCYAAASYLYVPLAHCSPLTKHCEETGF